MRQTTFSELRRHAKDYFDAVEAGDVVRVYRNGRPIADIVPVPPAEPAWKRPVARLTVRGVRLSNVVIEDRSEGPSVASAAGQASTVDGGHPDGAATDIGTARGRSDGAG